MLPEFTSSHLQEVNAVLSDGVLAAVLEVEPSVVPRRNAGGRDRLGVLVEERVVAGVLVGVNDRLVVAGCKRNTHEKTQMSARSTDICSLCLTFRHHISKSYGCVLRRHHEAVHRANRSPPRQRPAFC